MTRSESRSPRASEAASRKGTLFCPDCAHASPFDGDWDVCETTEVVTYHCPDCGTCIQERPVFGPEATPIEPNATATAAPRFGLSPTAVERWRRAWSSWTTAWTRFVESARGR